MVDQDLHSSTFVFNGISLCMGIVEVYSRILHRDNMEKREDKIFQRKCQ